MSLFVREINNVNELKKLNIKLRRKSAINIIFKNDNVAIKLYNQSINMYSFLEELSINYKEF